MTFTAILTEDPDGGYVALNPETGTTTQGDNFQEALANLKEATELYLEPVRKVLFFAVGDFLALHFLTPARQKRVFSLF